MKGAKYDRLDVRKGVLVAVALSLVFSGEVGASVTTARDSTWLVADKIKHYTETASSGDVDAQLGYSYNPKTTTFSGVTLKITRAGQDLLNAVVKRPPPNSYARVWPANFWEKKKSVVVRDLDGDGEPEVLLALYWGGAHCCYFSYVYRYASDRYRRVYHLWGDPSFALRDLNRDGQPEFVSADDRFAYAFTDFADSVFPLQIWRYDAGVFANVTRSFSTQIRADAARSWRFYGKALKQRRSVYGILAAWTADECLLNHCAKAFQRLEALRRAGKLRGGIGDGSAERFLRHLRRFLVRNGYTH